MVIPLWSFVGECQVWLCALKSPVIMLLSRFNSREKREVVLISSMSVVEDKGGT